VVLNPGRHHVQFVFLRENFSDGGPGAENHLSTSGKDGLLARHYARVETEVHYRLDGAALRRGQSVFESPVPGIFSGCCGGHGGGQAGFDMAVDFRVRDWD